MLSAIRDSQDSPLYAGRVDAHRADGTMAAAQGLKIVAWTQTPFHRQVDGVALTALIKAYVALVGPTPPPASRVEVLGGGSWHAPRSFGSGGAPLQGDYYLTTDLPDYRRTEIFAFGGNLKPSPLRCSHTRHDDCPQYTSWCEQVVATFDKPRDWDALVSVVDADGIPISGASVSLTRVSDGEAVVTKATSESGVVIVSADRDLYLLSTTYGGDTRGSVLDLRVPDAQGGATLRIGQSVRWRLTGDGPTPGSGSAIESGGGGSGAQDAVVDAGSDPAATGSTDQAATASPPSAPPDSSTDEHTS
jgi:hypothetical protein